MSKVKLLKATNITDLEYSINNVIDEEISDCIDIKYSTAYYTELMEIVYSALLIFE